MKRKRKMLKHISYTFIGFSTQLCEVEAGIVEEIEAQRGNVT